jgi:hypothetical protein
MSTTSAPERRWPREYRETAYELYAGPADQSVTKVADLLSGLKREAVPVSTVHRWKEADNWEERYSTESPVASPYLRNLHIRALLVAAPEAVAYLARVISGEEVPDSKRLRAAIAIETAARSLILKAADHLADLGQPLLPAVVLPDLSGLTMDGLEELERRRREERGRH